MYLYRKKKKQIYPVRFYLKAHPGGWQETAELILRVAWCKHLLGHP